MPLSAGKPVADTLSPRRQRADLPELPVILAGLGDEVTKKTSIRHKIWGAAGLLSRDFADAPGYGGSPHQGGVIWARVRSLAYQLSRNQRIALRKDRAG